MVGGVEAGVGRVGQQTVRGNYTFFQGDTCDGFGKNAPVYHGGRGGGREGGRRGSLICAWKIYINITGYM